MMHAAEEVAKGLQSDGPNYGPRESPGSPHNSLVDFLCAHRPNRERAPNATEQ